MTITAHTRTITNLLTSLLNGRFAVAILCHSGCPAGKQSQPNAKCGANADDLLNLLKAFHVWNYTCWGGDVKRICYGNC